MNTSSNATHLTPPSVFWAQRRDKVLITISLDDCASPTIEVKEGSLYFRGKGGKTQEEHEVSLEFNKSINPETSKQSINAREITFVLMKKDDSQGYWPRLLKDSKKVHFLKTDFDKWRDEDDSEEEESEDFNFDDMMSSMGGLQGAGDGGALPDDEGEDSDDEDLPDLQ